MTSIRRIENKIYRIEGFEVRILHPDGRDVRADRQNMPSYAFQRKAKDSMTVKQWIDQRFKKLYPGFRVEVLDWYGHVQHGKTQLERVRDSFFE